MAGFHYAWKVRARRFFGAACCLTALTLLGAAQPEPNEEPARDEHPRPKAAGPRVQLVRVPLPITGTVDHRVKQAIEQFLNARAAGQGRPTLVLEFMPSGDGDGRGTEFERALSLARYLAGDRLQGVRTIAYLPPREDGAVAVTGHAVLAAMACEEIVMHPDAVLGAAGEGEANIDAMLRNGYTEIADRRRVIPAAVALGMLDANLKVLKVQLPQGSRYILSDELAALRQEETVLAEETVSDSGSLARFTGNDLRLKYGFVSHLAANRSELARALQVPASALELDPSQGETWRAARIDVRGPINERMVSSIVRGLQDRRRVEDVNLILVYLDSAGGSVESSARLAGELARLEPTEVRTVAFIPHAARGDAALIALACDHVVMRKGAILGDWGESAVGPNELKLLKVTVRDLAKEKHKPWSQWMAMFDPSLQVYRYQLEDSNLAEYLCEEELKSRRNADRWARGEEVTSPDRVYKVTGEEAEERGLARYIVEDYEAVKQHYFLEDEPLRIEPGWAHEFIAALASPWLAGLLLFIGGFAFVAELSSPGIGIAGFISAVCFVLFFWSKFLHGSADWLEILLFLTGIAFIALEIFVVPGFGIFGLGGGALVIASLVLASQTFIRPQNDYQLQQMSESLMIVGGSGGALLLAMFLFRHHLQRAPMIRAMMLAPPDEQDLTELDRREALVDLNALMGQTGETATRLAPSGKALVGGRLVDAMSDGELLDRGTAVEVVAVKGNYVVVRGRMAN